MSEEIKQIMDFFGFGQSEGEIRGEHFNSILIFLKNNSGKTWIYVKHVSPLFIHMQFRYIKANYIDGLIDLGIIKFYSNGNNLHYKWIGKEALTGIITPIKTDENKNVCGYCGKEISKDKKYCDEECLRKHLKKRNSE